MTTNKTDHSRCLHPKTKAARAKCRASRARWDAQNAKWEAERAEDQKDAAAEDMWNQEYPKFAESHQASAHQNADDTACEEGFEVHSPRWYETAVSTLHSARDTAERLFDVTDPQGGQSFMIKGGTDYLWVDTLNWDNGWVKTIVAVDRDGARSTVELDAIDTDF